MNRLLREWWEDVKLSFTEFFWRFHPGRNRWCRTCGEFTGNSRAEEQTHQCTG